MPGTSVQTYAYGAIIRNLSQTVDALSVTVDETGLSSSGAESGVHFDPLGVIPAGATLYLGGTLYATQTASIQFDVKAEAGRLARPVPTPTVTHVALQESSRQSGAVTVAATVHNGLAVGASNEAYAVVFGPHGEILGGDYGYLDLIAPISPVTGNPVPLGPQQDGQLTFPFDDALIPLASVVRAEVSVQPELPGCCLVFR